LQNGLFCTECNIFSLPDKSKKLWVDTPLNPDTKISQSIAVFNSDDLDTGYEVLPGLVLLTKVQPVLFSLGTIRLVTKSGSLFGMVQIKSQPSS
jgi:hypothetical protein